MIAFGILELAISVIVILCILFAVWKGFATRRANAINGLTNRQDDVPVIERALSQSQLSSTAAREHEIARDFESAARLYQQAGLHAEAGRIRRDHIEPVQRNEPTVVKIDRVGDTILHDSVMIDSESEDTD